jgi:hypothetical protein
LPLPNSLSAKLQQIGLCAVPAQLDDFIAHATKSRWSAHQILEQLVKAEGAERSRRSLERRLRITVSFRRGCVRPPESRFLLGQEAADGGPADLKPPGDLGFC